MINDNDKAEFESVEKLGKIILQGGGLSQTYALEQQELFGFNELPSSNPKKLSFFIFDVLKEPMVYLILACGITYYFLGDPQEAAMLLGFLVLIVGITVAQEAKSERALEALKELSSPRAQVLRNGLKTRISGREVVRQDIFYLNEGDRVPADAVMLEGLNLEIDESLLTGESLSVAKFSGSSLFASTTVVRGMGVAFVTAIGIQTQIGKIGTAIKDTKTISTRLEMQTRQLVRRIAWLAAGLCLLVIIVYSNTRNNWIDGILAGLSLGMAILPNELPAVLTIFFSLGAWRLSKRKILTRKISAIENLGSITILCVDKTGTLTLNQMAIQKISSGNSVIDISDPMLKSLPEEFHETLEFGILASKKDPHDPMEFAFNTAGLKYLNGTEHLHQDWSLEKEYPLSTQLLSIAHAWKPNSDGAYIIGAKGAPEAIIDLCHLCSEEEDKIKKQANEMAREGLRILGIAKSHLISEVLPSKQHDIQFTFLGLIAIADPIRSGIAESISECHSAGIRVMMLTGDHPVTATSIAQKIGLLNPTRVVTGSEIEKLSDQELSELIRTINVFSRVMPAQKLRLVETLKLSGEIVAMTGDGVNDAPALKSSHVGIAMGGRGTDVAREASDIVLLNDDFSSIVEAIKTGRRIYTNIKNALVYIFAIHIPIAGLSVIPVLTRLPLILLPAHIAFLHLIIEPASSIAFEVEPESADVMKRKPRNPKENLFDKDIWIASFSRGFSLLIATVGVYIISLKRGQGELDARTLVITTLILSNTLLIYLSRGPDISFIKKLMSRPNRVVKLISAISLIMLIMALSIPQSREILRFSILHPIDIVICIAVALVSILLSELIVKISKSHQ
ncbi:MAG: cation-translocating P-type ATPase [Bacteriovorax sp.]|jgi:Ca2+-transporting ATPase